MVVMGLDHIAHVAGGRFCDKFGYSFLYNWRRIRSASLRMVAVIALFDLRLGDAANAGVRGNQGCVY
jgi:hypothetical protein